MQFPDSVAVLKYISGGVIVCFIVIYIGCYFVMTTANIRN